MEYYKPTNLFRQNAVRNTSACKRNFSSESWMWNLSSIPEILDKSCSNNQLKIASKYWKIPDDDHYLTSISINRENNEQIAISSGQTSSNLFIYQLSSDDSNLTHQQTITLPYISKLDWLSYDDEESSLLSGHRNGVLHLTSIPNSDPTENARIIKRFNHKRHFNSNNHRNLAIKQINIHQYNKVLTLCNENLFLWDLEHRSDLPILKNQNLGMQNFDSSPINHGIIAVAGKFGVAINDLRASLNEPSVFTPETEFKMGANNIKWAPYDSNVIAASHLDGNIRLWDIRSQNFFGTLSGHNDLVTTMQWSDTSSSDLYSGSRDGNIVHWDLNFEEDLSDCCLSGGLDSVSYHNGSFVANGSDIYKVVNQRQCGTLIPAAKDSIIEMVSTQDKILSIDADSFLGVHDKTITETETEEGISGMIMDELLESLPEIKDQQISNGSSDEESLFDKKAASSPTSTLINSPAHYKQQSITLLVNGSENSLNTLIDDGKLLIKRDSDSTINETYNTDYDHHKLYQNVIPQPSRPNDAHDQETPVIYL